ncbi:hypothetical protein [Micromonospora sp. NBC_01412]|uniref:hypothetical protein n=1 Tax=Micromonospora sp. NBC_01412 TaxID=2903590 RepID=UPI003251CC10
MEFLTRGRISELFGPSFAAQDDYPRQTRLPAPPLLLVDRVNRIDAMPGSMGVGTIQTETDVTAERWYVDVTGRMPSCLAIEAGQADMLLISWLGIDLHHQGMRRHRLLGCEVTFHTSPPQVGERLRYEIAIEEHFTLGEVMLFSFRYDCYVGDELRVSVRNGRAGYFTDHELADGNGLIWEPGPAPELRPRVDPPVRVGGRRSFDKAAVRAFAEGRPVECFGAGWERTRTHVRSPRMGPLRVWLPDSVPEFDPAGGAWGSGYLRAEQVITADLWFFEGHFPGDPCMPGTLMAEGCMQTMAFYLAALGYTVDRDGWRFEPVPGRDYRMRCRAQVTPTTRNLTYELFVREVHEGPRSMVVADVLCSADGLKAFHVEGLAVWLVPDWPLDQRQLLGQLPPRPMSRSSGPVAAGSDPRALVVDGRRLDAQAMLAYALGKPSAALGPEHARFDGPARLPRLPSPPYQFLTRVVEVSGPGGRFKPGISLTAEYDVVEDGWYFGVSTTPAMPLAVLTEVLLQPCGLLPQYVGSALTSDTELAFRNLDGRVAVLGVVGPDSGRVRTEATLKTIASTRDIILLEFDVRCVVGGRPVASLWTRFGYFSPETLATQAGLTPPRWPRSQLSRVPGIAGRPGAYRSDLLIFTDARLAQVDRVVELETAGGPAGLGRIVGEKDIDPSEWYFKAHFFQDPVQPGSLGLEAVAGLLRLFCVESGLTVRSADPVFDMLSADRKVTWTFRGQVLPETRLMRTEVHVTSVTVVPSAVLVVGEAWVWADDVCAYHIRDLGIRVRSHSRGE